MSLDIQHSAFILHNIINRIVAYIDIKTQNRIPNPKPPTPNPPPPLFFFFFFSSPSFLFSSFLEKNKTRCTIQILFEECDEDEIDLESGSG